MTQLARTSLPIRFALPRLGLPAACALLALAVGAAYLLVAWWNVGRFGPGAWGSTAVAAALCGVSASIALVLTARGGTASAVSALLGGMLIRMGVPLAAGLYITAQRGFLSQHGFLGQLMLLYLVTLACETLLSLSLRPADSIAASANQALAESGLNSAVDPIKHQELGGGKSG